MVMLNEGGQYLAAKTAKDDQRVKFLDEGAWVENKKYTYDDGSPKQDFIVLVEHEGSQKKLRLNKGSRDNMIEAFGNDTAQWVGREAKIVMTKTTKGEPSILLKPISNGKKNEVSW